MEKGNFVAKLISWFENNCRILPWRCNNSVYSVFLAEICLRRTGVIRAEQAYNKIIKEYKDFKALSEADEENLKKIFKPLGLTFRANYLVDISKLACDKFGCTLPNTYEGLINIRGIGRYTANAILCFAHGKKVPIVDINVKRLYGRYCGYESQTPPSSDKILWNISKKIMPNKSFVKYNMAILDFPALICRANAPLCDECIHKNLCEFT